MYKAWLYALAFACGMLSGVMFIEREHEYTCTTDTECMLECMQVTGKTQHICADH